jgi:asparagine synthase (glutamine-hydrolysing)
MGDESALPGSGWLLVSVRPGGELPRAGRLLGLGAVGSDGSVSLGWGNPPVRVGDAHILTRDPRRAGRVLGVTRETELLSPDLLGTVQPPFACAVPVAGGWQVGQDPLGFRTVYVREEPGWVAVSTSGAALARLAGSSLDESALAVASRLGWLVGDATPWRQVRALRRGATLESGRYLPGPSAELPMAPVGDPVTLAARILRETLVAFLDDRPDAVLQLTGGFDSRILLAAIPPERRSSVTAMTLRTASSLDAQIAEAITKQYGMRHVVRDFAAIEQVAPAEAFDRCLQMAVQLDGAGDPVASAAVEIAEGTRGTQPRIVGMGGEVARGFYYFGPMWAGRVSPARVRRFADWRLFANEAAPREMFTTSFASWAADEARRRVSDAFLEASGGWFERTDAFYLGERMRRWAGGLASAWCLDRIDMNPMLDPRFVSLVSALPPADKSNMRFLARLIDRLDPQLASLPMDGRPAPRAFIAPTIADRAEWASILARKVAGKVRQRLRAAPRPPEGGELLSAKVVAHLRADPAQLEYALSTGVLSSAWVERLTAGEVDASPAAVAFLLRLVAAARA